MRFLGLIIVLFFISTGCTGTIVKVNPESELFKSNYSNEYHSIGLRELPPDKIYPLTGNMTEAFGSEIRYSGFTKNVFYPMRPDDKVDIILDSKFDVAMDPNMGSGMIKAILTGATFFILEPFFWYDYDYTFSGHVDVIQNGQIIRRIDAKTDASMSMKWLSLFEGNTLQNEVIKKSKKSLFRQLMKDLER